MRQSTLMESLSNENLITENPVDTTSVDSLRQSFADDCYRKTREFYGAKYTDYLAALGVEASWSILDEPEVIGQKHCDLRYKIINSTANTREAPEAGEAVGDPAGYYDGVCSLRIKKTFCPEHGMICVYAVPKIDTYAIRESGPFSITKREYTEFYQPEQMTIRQMEVNRQLLNYTAADDDDQRLPVYEDYRKGQNLITANSVTTDAAAAQASMEIGLNNAYLQTFDDGETNVSYNYRSPAAIDNAFQGRLGGNSELINYQITSAHKLMRLSPLRPDMSSHGVA